MRDLLVRALNASASILHSLGEFLEVASLIVEGAAPIEAELERAPDYEGLTGAVSLTPEALDMIAHPARHTEPDDDEPPLAGSLEARARQRLHA